MSCELRVHEGLPSWREQQQALVGYLETVSASDQINIFSRWKAIQSLGKINPPSAIAALEALAETGGQNARQRAAHTLQKLQSR